MCNQLLKIHYIYDSTQIGGAEKQCRLYAELNGEHIVDTGYGFKKYLRIYNALKNTQSDTIHIFWLSRDQAIAGILSKFVKNKKNKIYYNIRNQPLNFWSNMRSYIYEKVAFSVKVDGWISNSINTITAYSEKYRSKPLVIEIVPNIIKSGQNKWKHDSRKGYQIIFVGHPNRIKGFDKFIDQLLLLDTDCIESIFIFGFERGEVSDRQLTILDKFNISYFGVHNNWFSIEYENAVLLNTSRSEGYPSAPLEALAHGIPILIPDHICYAGDLNNQYVYKDISEITVNRIKELIAHHEGQ